MSDDIHRSPARNPHQSRHRERLGDVPLGSPSDLDGAVAAAKRAFPGWRDTPVAARARFLFDLRNKMEQHYEELLSICTQEHGKTLEESKGDVRRGIDNVETAAGMPSMMLGSALEQVAAGIDCVSVRQPMGVFAVIAPYNFPRWSRLWFVPTPSLRATRWWSSPSEQVPFSQLRLFELMSDIRPAPGRGQHGQRRQGHRQRHPRQQGRRRRLLRRLEPRRRARVQALRRDRQASAGPRRREELHRGHGRLRLGQERRQHRRQRLRLRPASVAWRRASSSVSARLTPSSRPSSRRPAARSSVGEGHSAGRHHGPGDQRQAQGARRRLHRPGVAEGAELLVDGRGTRWTVTPADTGLGRRSSPAFARR